MLKIMHLGSSRSPVVPPSAASLIAGSLLASSLLAVAVPREARGHGGLPVPVQLLTHGTQMYVTTPFWGLFVGQDGGEWRWICNEAVNVNMQPKFALASDGATLYATDNTGLTVSLDGGCSWAGVTGTLAMLNVVDLAADPLVPGRAYALANDWQGAGQTGLWRSDDRGATWTMVIALGTQTPDGLSVAADGQTVAATGLSSTTPHSATLYEVGTTGPARSRPLTLSLDGQPLTSVAPLLYDGGSLYLQTHTDAGYALHRLDGTTSTTPTRLMATTAPIYQVARAPQGGSLLVATREGLYQQQADQSLKLLPTLSASFCLSPQGSTLYACAWNYAPDLAAVARLSPDLGSFTKVFRYTDTKGPISCPANTSVGMICPDIWATYSDQLADPKMPPPADMGTPPPAMNSGCSYDVGRASTGATGSALGLLAMAGLLAARRRRGDESGRAQ